MGCVISLSDNLNVIIMKEKARGVSPQLNSSSNSAVTQPVGQARNVRRNQQIKALHLEFEDLKKKIKDVQSKNERIIENIHKQYDFRKKPHNADIMAETSPILQYQPNANPTLPDNPAELTDPDTKPRLKKNANSKRSGGSAFHQSIEYRKTEHLPDEQSDSSKGMSQPYRPNSSSQLAYSAGSQYILPNPPQEQFQISQFPSPNQYPPNQYPYPFPSFPSGMAVSQVGSYYGGSQTEEAIRRQREKVRVLEQQLQEREADSLALKRLQKKYTALASTCSDTLEACFQEFFEEVVKVKLAEVEKAVKKSDQKLKKLQITLKDRQQNLRSKKLIEQHRSKRSQSRSRRESSPRQNYNSLTHMPRMPNKRNNQSLSIHDPPRSKQSEQSRSSQQFEEIATQYQEMIRTKTQEVEALEGKLRQKEKELIEMTARCSKLQAKSDSTSNSRPKEGNSNSDQAQLTVLNRRIAELEGQLQENHRQAVLKDASLQKISKKSAEQEAKLKKGETELTRLREQCRRLQKQSEASTMLKRLQVQLQARQNECKELREKIGKQETDKVQREYENLTMVNRLKKTEGLLVLREQKVAELEKIIQSSVGGEGDLLQRSMYLERTDQQDLHNLQAEKQSLQQELATHRQQIFLLQKTNDSLNQRLGELSQTLDNARHQAQTLQIQNESMRISLKAQQFEKYRSDPQLLQEQDCVSDEQERRLREELEEVRGRLDEAQAMLKLQTQRAFQENRKALKFASELAYFQEQLADREDRFEKLRREHQQGKAQSAALAQQLQQRESELEVQRRVNADKIHQIQTQWLQFQQEVRQNQQTDLSNSQHDDLRSSRHFSEQSFVNYRNTYNSLGAENERLQEKLKQAEKVIEVQKEMEDKIVSEYRSNVERLKAELREKCKESDKSQQEAQSLRRKVRQLELSEQRLKERARQQRGDGEEMLLGGSQRVMELQAEAAELRELNSRLSAVQQQLFGQIAAKEQEVQGLLRTIAAKERRIEQLQEVAEMKEMNFSSHISQSQHNRSKVRDSLQSQSSLRYSMLSNANRDRTMELQLSEAGESFFDQNQSMLSNVSQVFGREEFPYEKMQLRRVEQRRLFEKTAEYIKSLKKAIDQKSKRIRLLQRKIDSLRNSQLIRKDIYEVRESVDADGEQGEFRDYLSVQVERAHSGRLRVRQLEHETRLTIEENNLLTNQIESLQDQLLKAEEQENSLMKLKDLYKDQIKNLIKQNQDQAKLFEEELKKEKNKLQQADSIQKMEALKQIFLKIVSAVVAIQAEPAKGKRRDERRKQLQDYLKVCSNLLAYEPSVRQQLLGILKDYRR